MRAKVISKFQMAPDLRVVRFVGVDMVRAAGVITFDEKPPPGDSVFALRAVSDSLHGSTKRVHSLDVRDNWHNVDDRLGANSGNGGAADMVNGQEFRTKDAADERSFTPKFFHPKPVVRNDDNIAHFSHKCVRG